MLIQHWWILTIEADARSSMTMNRSQDQQDEVRYKTTCATPANRDESQRLLMICLAAYESRIPYMSKVSEVV